MSQQEPLTPVFLKRFWEHRRGRWGYARGWPCKPLDPLLIAGKGYIPGIDYTPPPPP